MPDRHNPGILNRQNDPLKKSHAATNSDIIKMREKKFPPKNETQEEEKETEPQITFVSILAASWTKFMAN